jgi:hypothetical protein
MVVTFVMDNCLAIFYFNKGELIMNYKKLLLASLSTSALLAGCGGGSGGGSSTPAPTPTPSPGDASFVSCTNNDTVCTISGTVDEDYTLSTGIEWRLSGVVTVGAGNVNVLTDADVQGIKDAGVTLTVEAGVEVKALGDGVLLVTRGSQLIADGTASSPITFSSVDDGYEGLGEWGGIVIQGFAPQYGPGNTGACFGADINAVDAVCNVEGEGGTEIAVYGGDDVADNSGIVRYVRIAEGGLVAGPNNEVNGLTLQGVGHGTTVEYVQVHANLDDGVEWFGGTVNAKYLVLTGNDDDDIDFDEGFVGNIQYAIVKKSNNSTPQGSNDPRGIEANSSDDEYVPQTSAALSNISIIGGAVNNNSGGEPGMRLRGGVNVDIYNTAVTNFDNGCLRIDNADTDGDNTDDVNSVVSLTNVLGDCDRLYRPSDESDATVDNVALVNGGLSFDGAYALLETEAQLGAAVSPMSVGSSTFTFDPTDYVGAVAPGTATADAWWSGWTLPGTLSAVPNSAPDFVTCADNTTCTVTGTITEDYTFIAGVEWRLQGVVTVGDGNMQALNDAEVQLIKDSGVTLTIEPGVEVKGFNDGVLLVTRGSKIQSRGTKNLPITFSSVSDADYEGLGEWGGVVVQGFAPQYGPGGTGACFGPDINAADAVCNVEGEGGTEIAVYGGDDPADNSGEFRYVRIAEGGLVAGPNNEVNGLTLQGVGHGTKVEYVQVHSNLDDGVEWFGGTVNAKYLVLTGNDDDDIDFDEGFKGNIQYALVKKGGNLTPQGSNDPRGIEANSSDDEYVPETEATLANISVIGNNVNNSGSGATDGEPGMRLRGGLTVSIFNTVVTDFNNGCIRKDDADTNGDNVDDVASNVTLTNVLGDCVRYYRPSDEGSTLTATNSENVVGGLSFDPAYALVEAEATVTAPTITATDNGSGFTFDNTTYVGAVEPGTAVADAWWSGWTLPGTVAPSADKSFATCSADGTNCVISGTIDEDFTFTRGVQWRLSGTVSVGAGNVSVADDAAVQAIKGAGVTLTIEPGADVRGLDTGILLVTRGSKIVANGTVTSPITFSSLTDEDFDGLGEWGGVVVQGFAPQYGPGGTGACFGADINAADAVCNVEGEGGTDIAVYGGDDPADDSGVIRYVRIAEGGLVAGPNNEVNGLTLQGVGHGTTVEYVQVHNNLDDGVEWFGGTVNAKYLVLTGNDDDDIDFDEGFQGNIQYALIAKSANLTPQGSNDPRGIEANSSDDEYVPETEATLANITIRGNNVNNAGAGANDGEPGMRLRGGLTVSIFNTVVTDFNNGCVRKDDADTNGDNVDDVASTVSLTNVLGDCARYFRPSDEGTTLTATNSDNVLGGLSFDAAYALVEAEATVAAPTITASDNGSGFTFDNTTYVGAVEPGTAAADVWWANWTIPGSITP